MEEHEAFAVILRAYFDGHDKHRLRKKTKTHVAPKANDEKEIFLLILRDSKQLRWTQRKSNRALHKKGKGIVFNIHLFIITSVLSIITRDIVEEGGEKAR